jgi:hypothetical protein
VRRSFQASHLITERLVDNRQRELTLKALTHKKQVNAFDLELAV